ncbi:FMN-dependent NADH-azoreductase [Sphingomonas nostoxanthinifaciens]|uniref:FMN-dependent NADH-azoreductase n=1 Tax=Sphingomonas nostoxanthinifaciens TaxID=2872652 RepID=UPI001CC1C48D|nr:NAD(P)H-dependent oxidoreductase [Sphingomonas nostoxanthinifaciens]UAK25835.1 NAD(P)H-dependent oxidoreductase [Sphingomonas nostoxanthinifaciens]
MKLLHLDSSITGEGSASRAISAAVVERLRETHADLDVVYRDLAAEPLPHMTLDTFLTLDTGEDVQQFLDADIVVIGAGFYNFTIPSQLKSWIDRIAVRGKTFAYGENGPVGLAKGKRVIVTLARGNVYGEGSPYVAYEHAETLLRSIFTFVGADVEFIVAEGLGRGEDARRVAIDGALQQVRHMIPSFAAPAAMAL